MRPVTDAAVIDREQPDLFGDRLPTGGNAAGTRRRASAALPHRAAGEPLQVPIDRLDDDRLHPRDGYPQECLDDLARDIAERGVLQAIVVAPPDARGRYRICFGVRRWHAARRAGLTTVPVAVRARPCEAYDQVAENLRRHGLSPLELAHFIRSRSEAGESNATIAKKLAVDQTTVAHHLTLLVLPPALGAALESGRCTSPRTLHELQKLHAEQPEAVARLLDGDLPVTRNAVAALRTPGTRAAGASENVHAASLDPVTDLLGQLQFLCDRLERLLARLADTGADRLPGERLAALRQRLVALARRPG
jgi:ParB family chromosome partitioning protein